MEILSKYPMISRLEGLFQSVYFYFCQSNKRHSELQKLVNLMETKGLKMLYNMEMHWISMRSPTQHILAKYKPLILKIEANMTKGLELLIFLICWLMWSCCYLWPISYHLWMECTIWWSFFKHRIFLSMISYRLWKYVNMSLFGCSLILLVLLRSKIDFPLYNNVTSLQSQDIPLQWKQLLRDLGMTHLFFDMPGYTVYVLLHPWQANRATHIC